MRFANYDGRLMLIADGPDDELDGATGIDVHAASGGRIPAEPQLALQAWLEVLAAARELTSADQISIDLELVCRLNGEEMQRSGSSSMLLPIPALIAYLSSVVKLLPGDVIFTGTPRGIGMTRTPPRYLVSGDRLESWVEGIGSMSHTFIGDPDV